MSRDARGVRRCVTALTVVVVITLMGVAPWMWQSFDASDGAARVRSHSVDVGSSLHSGEPRRTRFAEEGEGGGGGGAGCEREREDKVPMPLNELLRLVKASVSSGGNPDNAGAQAAALQLREVADALDPLYPAKELTMGHEEKESSMTGDTAAVVGQRASPARRPPNRIQVTRLTRVLQPTTAAVAAATSQNDSKHLIQPALSWTATRMITANGKPTSLSTCSNS